MSSPGCCRAPRSRSHRVRPRRARSRPRRGAVGAHRPPGPRSWTTRPTPPAAAGARAPRLSASASALASKRVTAASASARANLDGWPGRSWVDPSASTATWRPIGGRRGGGGHARFDAKALALADTEALARLLLRRSRSRSSKIEGLEVGGRRLLRAEAATRARRGRTRCDPRPRCSATSRAMTWALGRRSAVGDVHHRRPSPRSAPPASRTARAYSSSAGRSARTRTGSAGAASTRARQSSLRRRRSWCAIS